jgi:hypothetical protein
VVEEKIYALGGFTAYGGASLSVLEGRLWICVTL